MFKYVLPHKSDFVVGLTQCSKHWAIDSDSLSLVKSSHTHIGEVHNQLASAIG